MQGPLSVVFNFSHPMEMLAALVTGVGFGFALERAGFGRADNLVANFYARDFRVLRVMFTAIVTAMIGLYFFDITGFLPLSSIGLIPTFLGGASVGGLLIGAGFIIGGYCPGTSPIAAVSGKIDALLFMIGIVVGAGAFSLGADTFTPLENSGAKGRLLLHEYFHVSSGVMVFAVVLFAVGAFWAVSKIEAAVNRAPRPEAHPAVNEAHGVTPGAVAREGSLP